MTARARAVITLVASGLLLLRVFAPPSPMLAAPGGSALVALATQPHGKADPPALRDPHVRPADASARYLIAEGIRRSYTIARLIDAVEHSDVIVYVHVGSPPGGLATSQTRLMASGPNGWRYTSVWIDKEPLLLGRLEMLGHEFQHVGEIAEAREVTSTDSLEHFYERIGYSGGLAHAFETRRAVVVQLQVRQEVLADLDSMDTTGARPSAGASAAERRKLYEAYCAVCHGRNGRGRGPAHDVLSTRAPDLTLLAQRNGGAFPWSAVEGCVRASARRPPAAAGSDMPVWTALPSSDHDPGAAAHADSIAAYVESLQRQSR